MPLILGLDACLLLSLDGELSLVSVQLLLHRLVGVLHGDEVGLLSDPRALEVGVLRCLLRDLPLEMHNGSLEGSSILIELRIASTRLHQPVELFVEQVEVVLLLFDLDSAAPSLELVAADERVLLCKLCVESRVLLLELRDVGLGVKGVDMDASELVLHLRLVLLLLLPHSPELLGGLGRVLRSLLNGHLLAERREDGRFDCLRLHERLLNLRLECRHLMLQRLFGLRHLGKLCVSLLKRPIEHRETLVVPLLLFIARGDVGVCGALVSLELRLRRHKGLVLLLLLFDGLLDTRHLRIERHLLLPLLKQRLLCRKQRLVSPLHADQRRLPLLQQLLALKIDRLHLRRRLLQCLRRCASLAAL
mmetsp:Transcript_19199/g.39175  ORF Transcript_19199/g.39175 Transcript_19199/m.39175 type:complete len:362 (+) Transcript_19199:1181-2266(+)